MGLTFNADAHTYELDGVRVPSVTGILRTSGLIDFSGIPRPILEAARKRGTAVHQAAHYFNEHDLDVEEFCRDFPGYAGYLQSWIRLTESGRLQTVLCEHRLASRVYQFAGTADWLGLFDGHAAILDFATGDPEDAAKDLQTAGYLIAAMEWAKEADQAALHAFLEHHRPILRFSVRLKKTGALPTPTPYRNPTDFSQFIALATARQIVRVRRPTLETWQWQEDAA